MLFPWGFLLPLEFGRLRRLTLVVFLVILGFFWRFRLKKHVKMSEWDDAPGRVSLVMGRNDRRNDLATGVVNS